MGHGNGSHGWCGGSVHSAASPLHRKPLFCAPAAPAACSQRALFIPLNPVNERCRMKSPGSQYCQSRTSCCTGSAWQSSSLLSRPAMCGSQPCRLRLSRDECEGQRAGALCAAAQAYLVPRAIYGALSLRLLQGTVFSDTG